ncbi:hypothetical protein HYPSUDRAFT_200552 [Hypholoma sublateritium FD-334 SS-4]|uniref:Uncharacterized protein n=1 Tax=Hypholoma sublateritium (strain FD-334 SS-4) TaxID=945553 RepID=A0A0D2PY33_HYPSF|nr:hypothetical protein HYPSUDRAFT_200552 [Hypholoma sublateritium FD-334 SS-4]
MRILSNHPPTQKSSAYPIIITDVMNKATSLTCSLIDESDLKALRSTTTKIPRDVRRDNERPAGEIMIEAATINVHNESTVLQLQVLVDQMHAADAPVGEVLRMTTSAAAPKLVGNGTGAGTAVDGHLRVEERTRGARAPQATGRRGAVLPGTRLCPLHSHASMRPHPLRTDEPPVAHVLLRTLTCASPHLCLCPKCAAILEAVVWRICPPRSSTSMQMTKWIVKVCEIVVRLLLTRTGALRMESSTPAPSPRIDIMSFPTSPLLELALQPNFLLRDILCMLGSQ